jgi:cobalamin biosynthesis Mg chelatase CobN
LILLQTKSPSNISFQLCVYIGSKKKRASKKAMTQKTVNGEQSSKSPPPPPVTVEKPAAKKATATTTTTTATKNPNKNPQVLGYGLTVGCALVLVIAVGVFLLPYRFINKY